MSEFFRGWRRKVGMLTLVMAFVFMGIWIRSRNSVDLITVYGTKSNLVIVSGGSRFLFAHGDGFVQQMASNAATRAVSITIIPQKYFQTDSIQAEWKWWRASSVVVYPSLDDTNTKGRTVLMLSYWWIITPLTALSAILLLSKPRKSTPKKIMEPIPEKAA